MSRAVVIGCGVIGTACAHYLVESGWDVTMTDQGGFGKGSSHANCGLICPSHVLPLAEPGAVLQTLKTLFRRNSPFAIRARLDPALWSWLVRFARRCNHDDLISAGHAIQALLDSSIALYPRLIENQGLDCEWETNGLLYPFRDRAAFEAFSETERILRETFAIPARRFEGSALNEFEPALKDGLAGGWHYEHDAQLRPDRLLAEWRRCLEARGVNVLLDCTFATFEASSKTAVSAGTSRGSLPADVFVVATGAWTPRLNGELGFKVPIQPGKGYSLTMPRPAICPRVPLIFPETRVAVSPFQSGYRLGSTMEFAGYDRSLPEPRLKLLMVGAAPYLRQPWCEPIEERWFGWRPMTFDSIPIIDVCPRYGNVFLAAGHNMLGLSMAPATGRLISELVNGQAPHIDPKPYRWTRFA